jgi:hypothetical protein
VVPDDPVRNRYQHPLLPRPLARRLVHHPDKSQTNRPTCQTPAVGLFIYVEGDTGSGQRTRVDAMVPKLSRGRDGGMGSELGACLQASACPPKLHVLHISVIELVLGQTKASPRLSCPVVSTACMDHGS